MSTNVFFVGHLYEYSFSFTKHKKRNTFLMTPQGPNKGLNIGKDPKKEKVLLPNGNFYSLIIGINSYNKSPGIAPLNNARPDAEEVKKVLLEKYQFDTKHNISIFDEKATKSNIYRELEALRQKVKPNDSLFIYYSGHGEYSDTYNQGYWIPVDAEADDFSTYLPYSEILNKLKAIKSFHTLIISDSCYAGALFGHRKIQRKQLALERLNRYPSRFLITSGRNEVVPDGPPGENSPFASKFLWFIKNNEEKVLGARALASQIQEAVVELGSKYPLPRAEVLAIDGHLGGEFVFRKKNYELPDIKDLPPLGDYVYREIKPSHQTNAGQDSFTETDIEVDIPDSFESIDAIRVEARKLIVAADFDTCFKLLNAILDEDGMYFDTVIILESRYHSYKKDTMKQIRMPESLKVERNQILNSIQEIFKDLDEYEVKASVIKEEG